MSEDLYARQRPITGLMPPESVTVIGVGGVGCWVAWCFAGIGVKRIVVIDHDLLELHNMNRCLMYTTGQVGQSKV